GIRDRNVTGVQTCALPISPPAPGPDTTPPTIEFSMVTNDQGWLREPALLVIGRDASGVDHFICYLDGQYWPVNSGLPAQELRGRSEEHTSELQSRFDLVCR